MELTVDHPHLGTLIFSVSTGASVARALPIERDCAAISYGLEWRQMILPEYPRTALTVAGRPVIASGAVVLGRHDNEFSVHIDDLVFTFAFIPDSGALTADAQVIGANQIRIRFTGTIGALPISYELGGVAVWNGFWVDLAVVITGVDEGPVVRSIAYSFTGGLRTEPLK